MEAREFGSGAALSFALVSVRSLERALGFYRDVIGLEVAASATAELQVAEERRRPRAARLVLLHEPGTPVGRVLLAEFAEPGDYVRQPGDRTTRGFWNLNFYVDDIDRSTADLRARGYSFWSDPETYVVGAAAGVAREVVFETPDSVAINLVEPRGDASTFTGRVRAEVQRHGKTRSGFTPVATTAHCVHDVAAAVRFYREVLGMRVVLDEELGRPETNRFLARPPEARTHTVFVAGGHFYGKVALNEPQNFVVPERVAAQQAPNVGYLAQGFEVDSLAAAERRLEALGLVAERRPFPELGGVFASGCLQLRMPGSGGWALLIGPDGEAVR
jgi:catechol 2,3-dioxygenase-like lactoylglutathione lyase family enzyme